MLRCDGVLATKVWPPVQSARSINGPASPECAADIVAVSAVGLSIDGTMPKM